jgi:membrane-associated protease RseP (regulator of RpoE activity)
MLAGGSQVLAAGAGRDHAPFRAPRGARVGVQKTWEMSSLTVQMLWRMVTGEVSAKNISGPISIAEFAGISAFWG